jgi:hypothetical protein
VPIDTPIAGRMVCERTPPDRHLQSALACAATTCGWTAAA